mgnify:CR=1 FL=1|tara:strand:- start:7060 stop:7272 length:213 start_codon:yes stop_codon:yes gene_type:complete
MQKLSSNEVIKECRKLAKDQGLTFRRSKTVGTINGAACYEIESGIQHKILYQNNLTLTWENLLNESFKGQ